MSDVLSLFTICLKMVLDDASHFLSGVPGVGVPHLFTLVIVKGFETCMGCG